MNYTYEVGQDDKFDLRCYSEVRQELMSISEHLQHVNGNHKADIIISFLKDHCIRTEWFRENDEVIKLITSRLLDTQHIEALFNSCRSNREFLSDFERCISASLG